MAQYSYQPPNVNFYQPPNVSFYQPPNANFYQPPNANFYQPPNVNFCPPAPGFPPGFGQPQPLFTTPSSQYWGAPMASISSGLEPLQHARQLVVKQKKEMIEIFTGWEQNNRYEIYDETGQFVYYAAEDTSDFSMWIYGENRPFCIRIFDANRRQVIVLNATVDCCSQQVCVQVPQGNQVATIHKEFAFMTPSFFIKDASGSVMFKVKSPISAAFGSFGNVKFDIMSSDQKTKVGHISKHWGGFLREAFTDADTFGLSLPADMDVTWKAVLLAVLFHIDFTFYEQSNSRRR